MWVHPNPALNDEEREMVADKPERCMRQAFQRGALSLDEVTAGLAPHVAAVVRSVATGERLRATVEPASRLPGAADDQAASGHATVESAEWPRSALSSYTELTRLVDQWLLSASDALEVAWAIDHILGRYLTGTRYAVP